MKFYGLTKSFPFFLQKVFLIAVSILLVWVSSRILPNYLPADLKHVQKKARHFKRTGSRHKRTYRSGSRQLHLANKRLPCAFFLTFRIYCSQASSIWWFILVLLMFLSAVVPLTSAQDYIIPLIYGVSFSFFAQLGCIEHKYNLIDQIRSMDGAYCKQLFWGFLCHVQLSIALVLPIIIRSLFVGEALSALAALALAVFIPSLSILLGEVSQNSRLSEIVILILCFLMLNQPSLVIGISTEYINVSRIIMMFALSAVIIITSSFIRMLKDKNVI